MNFVTTPESAIPRQSLTSAVADKLREEIIRGTIPEGAQLRQDAIAMQYHVSRVPVREALRQLDGEGLITIVRRHGSGTVANQHWRTVHHSSPTRTGNSDALDSATHGERRRRSRCDAPP